MPGIGVHSSKWRHGNWYKLYAAVASTSTMHA